MSADPLDVIDWHVPPPHHYAIRNGKRVCLDCPVDQRRGWGVLIWCALGVAFWVGVGVIAWKLHG